MAVWGEASVGGDCGGGGGGLEGEGCGEFAVDGAGEGDSGDNFSDFFENGKMELDTLLRLVFGREKRSIFGVREGGIWGGMRGVSAPGG